MVFMSRTVRSAFLLLVAIILFSACNRMPDHARYIPKEAVAVAGVNLKGLGKKIAWNVITGSKLFKEMEKRMPKNNTKDAVMGIEKAGIDAMNTFYVYVKTDTRFRGGNRITLLAPLSDAGAWESYVKQVFPGTTIQERNGRKEAALGDNMYVGWSKNLLIIINVMGADQYGADTESGAPHSASSAAMDAVSMSAEIDNAFGVTKENSLVNDKRFTQLEAKGHDLTFWLSYEELMSQYMNGDMGERMGVAMSGTLWKDAGIAAGLDFVKGKITGDMHYYLSEDLKEIGAAMGGANADNEMLKRLPSQQMGMIMAMSLPPKAIKLILEKTGMLGLVNVGLESQGLTAENVLDAFSGDMAFVMNDFKLDAVPVTDTFMGQAVTHHNQKPSLSMTYAMKIGKKEEFQKLVNLAKQAHMQEMPNGFVLPLDDKDSVYLLMNDQYLVVSNKLPYANGFLNGDLKSQKMPAAAEKQVFGHPVAAYVDIQELFKNVDPKITQTPQDSAMVVESKKLLKDMSVSGGAFVNNAFEYHMEINFANTEENSIIQLIDYGMRISEATKLGSK